MKTTKTVILLTLLLFLGRINTFSQNNTMTFVIVTSENGSEEFNKQIALYSDVNLDKETNILTLIKSNGEVVKNFDTSKYYEGAENQAEIEERTRKIVGDILAIVTIDPKNDQLSLTIGHAVFGQEEILETDLMSLTDLDFKEAALIDMKNKLAIFCVK